MTEASNGLEVPGLQIFRARFRLGQSRNGRIRSYVVLWRLPSLAAGRSPGAPSGGGGRRPALPPHRPMAARADGPVVRRVGPTGRTAPRRPLGRWRIGGIHRWVRHSWLGFGVGIQSEPRHTGRPRSHMAGASFATGHLITGPDMRACSTIATGGSPISSSAVAERPEAISRA
jgi:hypothetical protein